jgi:hypothetical protein
VEHVCGNEYVVARPHEIAMLKFIASPQFHFIAAEHVKRSFVTLMDVRPSSLPRRKRDHPEPERF